MENNESSKTQRIDVEELFEAATRAILRATEAHDAEVAGYALAPGGASRLPTGPLQIPIYPRGPIIWGIIAYPPNFPGLPGGQVGGQLS